MVVTISYLQKTYTTHLLHNEHTFTNKIILCVQSKGLVPLICNTSAILTL